MQQKLSIWTDIEDRLKEKEWHFTKSHQLFELLYQKKGNELDTQANLQTYELTLNNNLKFPIALGASVASLCTG